jgi:hypothetical protein
LGLIDEPEADLRNVIHQFQRTAGLRIGAAHCLQLEIAQHGEAFSAASRGRIRARGGDVRARWYAGPSLCRLVARIQARRSRSAAPDSSASAKSSCMTSPSAAIWSDSASSKSVSASCKCGPTITCRAVQIDTIALALFAAQEHVAAGLLDKAVGHRQAETGALPRRFGWEERIEGVRDYVRGHARASVVDEQPHVFTSGQLSLATHPWARRPSRERYYFWSP